MTIKEIIRSSAKPFPSLEIVPPMKGVSKEELLNSIRPFMEFCPPFINVTRHREEFEYLPQPDGSYTRRTVRRRVSETAVCAAIQAEFKLEVVPHIICAGASVGKIEAQLQDMKFLGVDNVLALRGDCLLGEKRFTPEPDGYRYASELVTAIKEFSVKEGKDFCIGVGGYPEKHFESPNMDADISNLKKKVDAGADYIITQMFFDNQAFYAFRDKCREAGIKVPVIPGLKPLTNPRQLETIPEAFSLDIPQELVRELTSHAGDKTACYRIGMEWCSGQCRDLLAHGAPAVHFYTMGRQDNVLEILKNNF